MKNLSLLSISAIICVALALAVSGIFYILTLLGKYTLVDRLGGAGWVFFLTMIILLPGVIPFVKKRRGASIRPLF